MNEEAYTNKETCLNPEGQALQRPAILPSHHCSQECGSAGRHTLLLLCPSKPWMPLTMLLTGRASGLVSVDKMENPMKIHT